MDNIEILGYVASFFILASFLTEKIIVLRSLNSIGAFIFLFYGIHHAQSSVIFINSSILLINIVYIIKEIRKRKNEQK
jgi:hypothetical protein